MREAELYEELIKLEEKQLKINLFSTTTRRRIPVISVEGARRKSTLKKIIKIAEDNKAELELLPHGVIEIYFKETNE